MDRLGDDLFARSALALNQYRRTAGRYLRHQVEDAEHRVALAHNVGEVVALLERALELQVLFLDTVPRDSRANVGHQLFVVPRLLNEILCAGANRLNHVVHGAVRSDHDHRCIRLALANLRQQFETALSRQR